MEEQDERKEEVLVVADSVLEEEEEWGNNMVSYSHQIHRLLKLNKNRRVTWGLVLRINQYYRLIRVPWEDTLIKHSSITYQFLPGPTPRIELTVTNSCCTSS